MSSARSRKTIHKVLFIGSSGSGKTKLLNHLCPPSEFISTIGIDFKIVPWHRGNEEVKLQIWDTAGQERFKAITTSYYRGTDVAVFLFDPASRNCFECALQFLSESEKYSKGSSIAQQPFMKILLAHYYRSDVTEYEVSTSEAFSAAFLYDASFHVLSDYSEASTEAFLDAIVDRASALRYSRELPTKQEPVSQKNVKRFFRK